MSLYRDIKPHNVMLDVDDEDAGDIPVLLDFGSMGVARVSISNISEARALQVQLCQHRAKCSVLIGLFGMNTLSQSTYLSNSLPVSCGRGLVCPGYLCFMIIAYTHTSICLSVSNCVPVAASVAAI